MQIQSFISWSQAKNILVIDSKQNYRVIYMVDTIISAAQVFSVLSILPNLAYHYFKITINQYGLINVIAKA